MQLLQDEGCKIKIKKVMIAFTLFGSCARGGAYPTDILLVSSGEFLFLPPYFALK